MGWDKVREATLARQKALGIVPRILDAINDTGELDYTLVIYIQGDNGASAEGTPQGLLNEMSIFKNIPEDLTKCWPVWTTRPLYGLKRTSVSGVPMPHNDPIAHHVEWSRGYATMKDTYLSGGSCWGAV